GGPKSSAAPVGTRGMSQTTGAAAGAQSTAAFSTALPGSVVLQSVQGQWRTGAGGGGRPGCDVADLCAAQAQQQRSALPRQQVVAFPALGRANRQHQPGGSARVRAQAIARNRTAWLLISRVGYPRHSDGSRKNRLRGGPGQRKTPARTREATRRGRYREEAKSRPRTRGVAR